MAEAIGASTDAVHRELDRVLRSLTGSGIYRDNAFRITGLATDATPRQVRRSREERMNPFYVPPDSADLAPLPPETDADLLHHAFEALRDPLLRITHELLWLRPDVNEFHPHNAAVRTHCGALQDENDETAWPAWEKGLRLWASVLEADETWQWAKGRVREIDDPRLTLAAVRALQERLPEHLVGVNVDLAAKAAADGDTVTADLHMLLLEDSPFQGAQVRKAARDGVRSAEARIKAACETASEGSASKNGLAAARTLLEEVEAPLRVVEALLGSNDPLNRACRDEVATIVNRCAVGTFNKRRTSPGVAPLLRRARDLAVSEGTVKLIDENLEVVSRDPLLDTVGQLRERGQVDAAAARLRAWHQWTKDPDRKAALGKLLADPRTPASPPQKANAPGCVFFLGANLYGERDSRYDQGVHTHISTLHLTFLWIPLVPLTAHIVGYDETGAQVYGGRVPLSQAARRYRVFALIALPALVCYLMFGEIGGLVAGVTAALIAAASLGIRQGYLHAWVKDREAGM